MAQLIVRDIEEEIVKELKVRAARNGRSAEEEHRQILRRALKPSKDAASFKEMLEQMPDVGDDSDFARIDDYGRPIDL
jgi:antitoxin FitA